MTKPVFYKFEERKEILNPILRSDACFYFKTSEDDDTLCLLYHYWLYKNGMVNLNYEIIVRNLEGQILAKKPQTPINFESAKSISIKELIKSHTNGSGFTEGSFEVIFTSTENLKFAYPAVICLYKNKNYLSAVHTYTRFLSNDLQDKKELLQGANTIYESNMFLPCNPDYQMLLFIQNGKNVVLDQDAEIEILNTSGKALSKKVSLSTLGAYETRILSLVHDKETITHLDGNFGTVGVKMKVNGVFPRILFAIEHIPTGKRSYEHSNFGDNSRDFVPAPQTGINGLVMQVPFNLNYTDKFEIHVFPTFTDTNHILEAELYDEDGNFAKSYGSVVLEGHNKGVCLSNSHFDLTASNVSKGSIKLKINNPERIPTRLHVGIAYSNEEILPGLILDGPFPYTDNGVNHRWAPILNSESCDGRIQISNMGYSNSFNEKVDYTVEFYREKDGEKLITSFEIPANGMFEISNESVPNLRNFLNGQPGWALIKSKNKLRNTIHFLLKDKSGSIGCDHAF